MRQKVSESLYELIQAQQQPQTHSWNARREFIFYFTNQQIPEATPKQSHLGTSLAQCWTIPKLPFTPVYQEFGACRELQPRCVLISVPRQGAQACPVGCPQVYQTPPSSITRCSTSQCTQRVNSSRCVFFFTATSDFAIPSCKVT